MEEGTSVTTIHFSTIGKVPPGGLERIPFGERLTCSVNDAAKVSGLSRSMIYNKMKSGEIEWTKIGARRLIKVPSLLRFLGVGCPFVDDTARGA
jgi:excisionase family DNA binding protein